MKIRMGFVSNSSSSSFAIYGTRVDSNEVLDMLLKHKKITKKQYNKCQEEDNSEVGDIIDWGRCMDNFNNSLVLVGDFECYETLYIGRELASIDDDETGKQFKESTEKELKDLFGKEMDCETVVGETGC